jgi:AbrB family looped-hinge helix DNA binding protein
MHGIKEYKIYILFYKKGEIKMEKEYTGMFRRIDDLGRVVIPKVIRKRLGIKELDLFDIYITEEGILFIKRTEENNE